MVHRDEPCLMSSQKASPQRSFRVSQIEEFITVFKLQPFILIISWNLPLKSASSLQNFDFRKYLLMWVLSFIFIYCYCSKESTSEKVIRSLYIQTQRRKKLDVLINVPSHQVTVILSWQKFTPSVFCLMNI